MSAELWGSLLQCVKALAPAQLPMNGWACSRRPSTTACWPCCNVLGRGKDTRRFPFSDNNAVSGSFFLLTIRNSWLCCFRCGYTVSFWHMWCRARISYSARLSGRSFAILPHSPWSGLLPWTLGVCAAFWPKPWRAMCSQEAKSSCFNSALGCEHPSFLWSRRQPEKPSGTSLLSSSPSDRKWRQLALQTLSHINSYFETT